MSHETTRCVAVLGCGRVGAAMVRDLAADGDLEVLAVDARAEGLAAFEGMDRVETQRADLSDPAAITSVATRASAVIGALPSRLGYAALEAVLRTGTPYCDISFMPQDPRTLDGLARENGVAAVVDCGVAPGLANMIIGHLAERVDEIDEVVFYVGGLPRARHWPFEYKAPFAPADVIEEYTRPARFIEAGRRITRPALSDSEFIEVPGVGTLEAFNTDGLRSLLDTVPAKTLREKTLRYPGHRALMEVLRESGFFSNEPIEVEGQEVRPLGVTSKLLFDAWQLQPREPEFTYLEVRFSGREKGVPRSYRFTLFDELDSDTGESSMARTTGFPCTIITRLLLDGQFKTPGVHPPEVLGRSGKVFEHVVGALARRGVVIREEP